MRPPSTWELGLILVVVLIIFGVGKLPQVGAALGKSISAFRRSAKGEDEEESIDADSKKKSKRKTKKTVKKTATTKPAEDKTEAGADQPVAEPEEPKPEQPSAEA
jgi:sec-independent protein translocase protein TatA